MKEKDIVYENGNVWVYAGKNYYSVMVSAVASISESSYAKNPDGLSIAIARCDYLAEKIKKECGNDEINKKLKK